MSLLRRRPAFRTLIVASTISLIGDFLSFVALAALSLGTPGGFTGLALVLAAHVLPKVMLAPWAGLVADRFEKRAVMLFANVAQGVFTLGMAYAAYRGEIGMLRVLVFVRSAISAFHTPAEAAAVPRLLTKDELVLGNTLMSTSWGASLVFGMALGGFVAVLGPTLSMLVDAGTFVVASALLVRLPKISPVPEERADPRVVRATLDAFRTVSASPHLVRAFLSKSVVALPAGIAFVLLHAVVFERFTALEVPIMLGALQALRGTGTLVGPVTTSMLGGKGTSLARILSVADVLVTIALIGLLVPSTWALGIASLVLGIGSGTNWMISTVVIQRDAHVSVQGRLAALDELAWTVVYALAAIVAGVLLDAGVSNASLAAIFAVPSLIASTALICLSPTLGAANVAQAASSSPSA